MGVLEKFMAFAQALPPDSRTSVEDVLETLMATHRDDAAFTVGELAELDRRLAEPSPRYAALENIESLLGRSFRK